MGGRAALAEDDLRPLPCLELPALPTLHHNVVGVDCNTAVDMSNTAPLERSSKRSRFTGCRGDGPAEGVGREEVGAAGGAQAGVAADVPLALVVRDDVVVAARIFELRASIVRPHGNAR